MLTDTGVKRGFIRFWSQVGEGEGNRAENTALCEAMCARVRVTITFPYISVCILTLGFCVIGI